jgi:hypothetical protein
MTILEPRGKFQFTPRNIANIVIAIVIIVVIFNFFSGMYFDNPAGWYTVKQDIITGRMRVYSDPGWTLRLYGYTYTFKFSEIYYFSKHLVEGDSSDTSIHVRFNDGGKAAISGNVRLEMPIDDASRILLQRHFRTWENFLDMGVRKVIDEAVILTASLMTSEESYATKRALFSQMVSDQIQHGIYLTEEKEEIDINPKTSEKNMRKTTVVKRDAKGNSLRKDNPMKAYGMRWNQFIIKEIDYERDTLAQIEQKRAAVQSITTSIAEAEKAAQIKITAEEIGKQVVTETRYRAEVEKQSAIVKARQEQQVAETRAQQRSAVADLDAQAAEQEMKASTLRGEAEYQVARKRLEADGALALKGDALVRIQRAWAEAFQQAKKPLVPEISGIAGVNGISLVQTIMDQITARLSSELGVDLKPAIPGQAALSRTKGGK